MNENKSKTPFSLFLVGLCLFITLLVVPYKVWEKTSIFAESMI